MFEKTEIFEALNELTAAWKEQFENPPEVPMAWTERDGDGMAFMDDLEVCPVAMVDEDSLQYDTEDLWIGLVDGDEVHIKIYLTEAGKVDFLIVP